MEDIMTNQTADTVPEPRMSERYTETTWDTVGHVLNRDTGSVTGGDLGWTDVHDLDQDLAAESDLTRKQAEALSYSARTGMPVRLTWTNPFGQDRVQVTTAYVVVDRLVFWGQRSTDQVYVRYTGFSHSVHLFQIRDAVTPMQETTFEDIP